jgi:putative flippase GtrA
MKTLKQSLQILVSSPLLWIGTAGSLVSFLTYYLLWSGRLQSMAGAADAIHIGFAFMFVFPFVFVASICIAFSGIILGIVRLCQKRNERTAAKAAKNL